MAAFEYKALDEGKKVDGVIDADAKSARSQLKGMGLFPSEIKSKSQTRCNQWFWSQHRS